MTHPLVRTHPDVVESLKNGQPVVALETAVVTHGMPRTPSSDVPRGVDDSWDVSEPVNLGVAHAMTRAVREGGATPAVIGVIEGRLTIGMDDDELRLLASDTDAMKVSTRDLVVASVEGKNGGTTVAATLESCMHAQGGTIRVLATGGIGGVHAGWTDLPDVSADIDQLSTTPVCVVCAGAKSMLDLRATLELLDARRVMVLGYQSDRFARFVCRSQPDLQVQHRVDDVDSVAHLSVAHWFGFGGRSAVVVSHALPEDETVDEDHFARACEQAEREASDASLGGASRTPTVLARINDLTNGATLASNIILLRRNATLASQIAIAMRSQQTRKVGKNLA